MPFDQGIGLSLSGGIQLTNSIKLISENSTAYGFAEGEFAGSAHLLGIRFFGDKISGDIAQPFAVSDGEFSRSPIPYVGFSYTF